MTTHYPISLKRSLPRTLLALAIAVVGASIGVSQSSDVNFPTPLTTNQINGVIRARDIGDNRSTTHYFLFEGEQGDIFINVVTRNLDADIDVFAVDGMRPLTKMVVYSNNEVSETGRLLYLRKPEKLLLRIQGRSPDDREATYQVKFAGSFLAMKDAGDATSAPTLDNRASGSVRVNSVGTIIPEEKRPPAAAQNSDAEKETAAEKEPVAEQPAAGDASAKVPSASAKKPAERRTRKPEVVVTEAAKPSSRTAAARKKAPPASKPARRRPPETKRPEAVAAEKKASEPDPLENVRLVIVFKDGNRSEVKMPELLRFTVDKGTLTVIRRSGTIERYSMVDVARVTIE